jgi:hypothetical protein
VPGKYVFTLRAFDDLHITTKDIQVEVSYPSRVESQEEAVFGIYPNPTSGDFNIYIKSTEPLTNNNLHLHITDIIGRTVYEEGFTAESGRISKTINPNLLSGIYFVQVMINGRNYSAKLVVGW